LGVPRAAQQINGLGVDEGGNHAPGISGVQEPVLLAFGLGGDDVLKRCAHGTWY